MIDSLEPPHARWFQRVIVLALFAAAFGYMEAAVVVDLRVTYDSIRQAIHPDRPPDSLLPLLTIEELRDAGQIHLRQLWIEVGREFAAMIILGAVAALAVRHKGEWLAMFMIAFGLWDIVYYIGLKAMVDFPASLMTSDILFLLPVPWLGPVLAPVIVSISLILAGLAVLYESARMRPILGRWFHWTGVFTGGSIVIVSFCKDYAQTLEGEMPERYNWALFVTGEAIGWLAFGHAFIQGRKAAGRREAIGLAAEETN